ncbi:hypothetical protein [Kocuria rosea]|uniref:hypothetical protein n=1 Tax=Kocuria rosea TaxID=1275 RepID=UPI0011AB2BEA|nr:hypothetical protein [Kocuria rosea]
MTTKTMRKPLSLAALLGLLVLTGCGADDTKPSAVDNRPEVTTSASPTAKTEDDAAAEVKAPTTQVDPVDVEIPEEVTDAYGQVNAETLAPSAIEFVSLMDGQADLQRVDKNLDKVEPAFQSVVKPHMTPDAYSELWKAITSKDGTSVVAMWAGDASVEVGGRTYTLTENPWTFNYGEPLIEDVPKASVPTVRYSQTVDYLLPVTAEDGSEQRLTTRVTRSYTLQPGPAEGWIVNGIWTSVPTPYKVMEVAR